MKQINLTAEQITRSYPKRNKTMISGETGADGGIREKEYISFEPVPCNWYGFQSHIQV